MIVRQITAGVRLTRAPAAHVRAQHPRRAPRALIVAALCGGLIGVPAAHAATPPPPAPTKATFRTQALPLPATASRSAEAGTTTLRLRAAKRFSLAGLRWDSGAPLRGRLRAQRSDGSWTPWAEIESESRVADGVTESSDAAAGEAARRSARRHGSAGATEPIWTGPSRRLEVQVQGRVPRGLRAAFVDVSGRAPVGARAARANTAGIQPRTAWDPANECKPRSAPVLGSVQAVTVHHTAGSNLYSRDQVPGVILAICKYHRNGQGWNDVGYNVIVDKYGGAWEGRAGGLDQAVVGAHAQGFNANSAGVSLIGDYSAVEPPPEAVATIGRVAAWKLAVAGVPRTGTVTLTSAGGAQSKVAAGRTIELPRVFAHRDVGQTACPGDAGYAQLGTIRAAAGATDPTLPIALPQAPAQPPAPSAAKITISTKREIVIGATSVVAGTATQSGKPLARASLALQIGGGSSWSTVARETTNAAGKYRFARKFTRSWGMRVVYTGTGGGQSAAIKMTVAPKLALTVPKRLPVGRKITLRGTIAPGRGPVTLEVARRTSKGTYVKTATVKVRQKGRTLTVPVTPKTRTLYRFQLKFAGSKLAAPARSKLTYGRAVTPSAGGGAALR